MSKKTKKILSVVAIGIIAFLILSMINVSHQREALRQARGNAEIME